MDAQRSIVKSISIAGKIFIVLAVFLALKARNTYDDYLTLKAPTFENNVENASSNEPSTPLENKVSLIKKRNILAETTQAIKKPEAASKKSTLNLRLVGTTLAPGIVPIAIIEDSSSKKQDAFSVGEEVFSKATLKEVYVSKVTLERDGKLETLEVTDGEKSPGDPNQSNIRSDGGNFVIPEEEVTAALANLPVLLSQARAVPYFRNGQSVGMRLYAIKAGSLYEKIGLKNSDIIKQINNNAVNDPSKALKLFEDLKTQRSISVGVERNGQELQLNYQIR